MSRFGHTDPSGRDEETARTGVVKSRPATASPIIKLPPPSFSFLPTTAGGAYLLLFIFCIVLGLLLWVAGPMPVRVVQAWMNSQEATFEKSPRSLKSPTPPPSHETERGRDVPGNSPVGPRRTPRQWSI